MSVVAQRAQGTPDGEMSLAEIVAEMKRLREIIASDRAEIERIRLERHAVRLKTQATMDELKSMVFTC